MYAAGRDPCVILLSDHLHDARKHLCTPMSPSMSPTVAMLSAPSSTTLTECWRRDCAPFSPFLTYARFRHLLC